MNVLLKNAKIFKDGTFGTSDFFVTDGILVDTAKTSGDFFDNFITYENCYIFPGFCDVHVHFREPGFSYKETIATGSAAAARGGYTAVCTMPNLLPAPDSADNLKKQLDIIERDAVIKVYPYGTITKGQMGIELSDMSEIANDIIAFSDDGRGVQSEELMLEAMKKAKTLGKIIVAHCEDNSLLNGGYIHKGEYARINGHTGICSESEWKPIERDIALAERTGCPYHVCHISTKESVSLIREAKARGVDITCETAPHYLVMNDMELREDGRFKMNPPIRSEEDRKALVEGIIDGTIDMISTDHAPHSLEEKSKGLRGSLMGVVGIETSFQILYTYLVKTGVISLERLVALMSLNARARFGITADAGYTVWNLAKDTVIDPEKFLSMGRSTPFAYRKVCGENLMTLLDGRAVYEAK
ncbi:MAG: dihydroorotase [Clostridia bacterium]|nr:dihydroorotase [Clostridia bacterium]